ncbi:MAG: hypothetical protein LBK23_06090 [Oscillospiraceae bacterium]|jgi:hypothetical protein|nr:hypothetical protein [Oscillospiraceae bacterium]
MENTLVLNPGFGFEELREDELLAVDGGNWLSTLCGVALIVGSVAVAAAAIVSAVSTGGLTVPIAVKATAQAVVGVIGGLALIFG